jgi:hypothetical protein
MASLIQLLDSRQAGENGHVEHSWSSNVQEKILQFSFQLTRTDESGLRNLEIKLKELLSLLNDKSNGGEYKTLLYKMIGYTRDIVAGKGECALTYMMIRCWYDYWPDLAKFALSCLVTPNNADEHPLGSWKDIKYFCEYCRKRGDDATHPLIARGISLINEQLTTDYSHYLFTHADDVPKISLLAKWIPREKSNRFGWLFELLATSYFPEYIEMAHDEKTMLAAKRKCMAEYRKIISCLNKQLDTLQIKQCANEWSDIDFKNVTSISMAKQTNSFLNVNKNKTVRYSTNEDRIKCAENFSEFVSDRITSGRDIKGQRVGMADFTKKAIELLHTAGSKTQIDVLNSQWRDNSTQNDALGNAIAMVDVSGSMDGDPLHVAVALGIRIAEKSQLGKRVMTFSASPKWVNLQDKTDFVEMVDVIRRADWGMNTNFHAALDMILEAIVDVRLSPEEVEDMTLVILSDMQMDQASSTNMETLYESMRTKYGVAGIRAHGKPYKPPHILFWNLRSTDGFPSLSSQPNTSMLSGFNPVLLNQFCDQGRASLEQYTPWTVLTKSLENPRYNDMGDKINGQ